MPLLLDGKLITNDTWSVVDDDSALPDSVENTLISLPRFIKLRNSSAQVSDKTPAAVGALVPDGVCVEPEDNVLDLAPHMTQLRLIAINFPVYTDGRGYSQARLIKKRMAFCGELRAVGDVRADQILFMARLGFDSFSFTEQPDLALIDTLVSRYRKNYQPSYGLPDYA